MAANQTSNQRNKSGNSKSHGGGSPMRRPEPEHEESGSAYGAIGEMAEQASEYVSESAAEMQECIRERSGTAVMVSLVAGFGVGILVGRAPTKTQEEPRSRRYRSAAEGVGRRLMDRIEAMIPDALAEHFSK